MEYCEKGSLRQVLDSDCRLSWTRRASMSLDAAQGLYRSVGVSREGAESLSRDRAVLASRLPQDDNHEDDDDDEGVSSLGCIRPKKSPKFTDASTATSSWCPKATRSRWGSSACWERGRAWLTWWACLSQLGGFELAQTESSLRKSAKNQEARSLHYLPPQLLANIHHPYSKECEVYR